MEEVIFLEIKHKDSGVRAQATGIFSWCLMPEARHLKKRTPFVLNWSSWTETSQRRGIKCSGAVGKMGKGEPRNRGKSNL